ncbi:hypothetical protein ACVWZL_008714 [Bradyrhizobium sp. GM2.4]
MPSRITLPAAELHFLAVAGEVLLDLDDEIRVGQPHLVAGGRAEHVGIDGTLYFDGHHKPRLRLNSGSVLTERFSL